MSKIRKALFFSVLNQYALQVISIVSAAIIGRLLTPEAIGVFSVATTIAFVAIEIRAFGVAEYLIREKEIRLDTVRSVLGVMVIMSWGMALLLAVAAPWIADFYNEPDLRNILWIMTVPFLFAPYSSVPFALLNREMRFDAMLRINLLGSFLRNAASIALIWLGLGYYGLAWGALIGVVAEFLAITYFRPAEMAWWPSFRGLRQVFRAGAHISASRFLYTTSQNSNDLVLGRMSTMNDVGLFSRGVGLIMFINGLLTKAVGSVVLPHLSQVRREGGNVAQAYLESIALLGAVALPLFAVVSVVTYPIMTALFGDQWEEAARLSSILCLWVMFQSVHCFSTQALLASGGERYLFPKEAVSFGVKVVAMVLAVPYGLHAVAWAVAFSGLVDLVFVTWLMRRALGLRVRHLVAEFLPNLLVTALCWAVVRGADWSLHFQSVNAWLALLIVAAIAVPTWAAGLRLTGNKAWAHLGDTLSWFSKLGLAKCRPH